MKGSAVPSTAHAYCIPELETVLWTSYVKSVYSPLHKHYLSFRGEPNIITKYDGWRVQRAVAAGAIPVEIEPPAAPAAPMISRKLFLYIFFFFFYILSRLFQPKNDLLNSSTKGGNNVWLVWGSKQKLLKIPIMKVTTYQKF